MLIDKGKLHEAGPTNTNGGWTAIHKDSTAAMAVLPSSESLSGMCACTGVYPQSFYRPGRSMTCISPVIKVNKRHRTTSRGRQNKLNFVRMDARGRDINKVGEQIWRDSWTITSMSEPFEILHITLDSAHCYEPMPRL